MKKLITFLFFIIGVIPAVARCDELDDALNNTMLTKSAAEQQVNTMIAGLSVAGMIWGLVFSSIGVGFFLYGKNRKNMKLMLVSALLVAYPYVVQKTMLVVIVGLVLTVLAYLARK